MAESISSVELELETQADVGDWDVLSLELEEALNDLYECTLDVCQPRAEGGDPNGFLGHSCIATMSRGGTLERRVCGIVSRVQPLGVRQDYLIVRLTLVPGLFALTQQVDSWVYQNEESVTSILEQVFAAGLGDYEREHDASKLKRKDYPKREFVVQYRESRYAFAARLMEEEGINFYFDHSGDSEKIVLFDDNSSVPAVELLSGEAIPMVGGAAQAGSVEAIDRLRWSVELRPTKVTLRDYDWTQPGVRDLVHDEGGADALGREREIYRAGPHTTFSEYSDPSYQKQDADLQARLRLEAETCRARRASGSSHVIGLRPGVHFKLSTSHAPEADEKYLVTRAIHRCTSTHTIVPGLEAGDGQANYSNSFECVAASVPYRPARRAKEPRILGPQTARVVGPEGEEIYTDEHGRVKVQFHWDRQVEPDQATDTSCWIRVSQQWAGPGYGTIWIPRVGMEVIVTFLGGHPDRPLITGCAYNGENPLPYGLPDEKTKSSFYTNSSLGGGGHNELTFEDAKGSEQIYTHAQKDHNTDVKNDETTTVGANRDKQVTANDDTTIDADRDITVHSDWNQKVDGDFSVITHGERTHHTTGATEEKTTGNHERTVAVNVEINCHATVDDVVDGTYERTVTGPISCTTSANEIWEIAGTALWNVGAQMAETIGGVWDMAISGIKKESFGGDVKWDWDSKFIETSLSLTHTTVGGVVTSTAGGYLFARDGGYRKSKVSGKIERACGHYTAGGGSGTMQIAADGVKFDNGSSQVFIAPGNIGIKCSTATIEATGQMKIGGSKSEFTKKTDCKLVKMYKSANYFQMS